MFAGDIVVSLGRVVADGSVVAGALVTDVGVVVVVGGVGAEPVNHGEYVVDTAVDCGAVDGGVTGELNRSGTTAPGNGCDMEASLERDGVPPLAGKATLGIPNAPMLSAAKVATRWW
jgi:hypothetical protein